MSSSPIVEIQSESAAHTVLNSILTQVAKTKKSYKTKMRLSYADLMGGIGDDDSFADVDLQIEIRCKWVEVGDEDSDNVIVISEDSNGDSYE